MNVITVAGNITRDCEVRHLPNGDAVAGFGVADNQGKDKPAIFWNASLFGKRAESLSQYLVKGTAVTITGTVTEREYVNKDGVTVKAQDIRVNDVALQGGKRDGGDAPARSAPTREQARDRQAAASRTGANNFDDDVPFRQLGARGYCHAI